MAHFGCTIDMLIKSNLWLSKRFLYNNAIEQSSIIPSRQSGKIQYKYQFNS
jgi:hypothetical protein